MSQILRAPTSFLTAIASAAYSGSLSLFYAQTTPQALSTTSNSATLATSNLSANSNAPVAVGAAAAAFINAGSQILTGMPTQPGPAPTVPTRSWRLVIPASQANAQGLGVERTIELNEECCCLASEPGWLLALGFAVFTPATNAPVPQVG